ncbi:MAG: hypothetical protein O7J95_03955 [Planctomycetota bacterium]|nr:hypothetical protein [Planctomycetota bacterium]
MQEVETVETTPDDEAAEGQSERYELSDFFDYSPETVMVYKTVGIVVLLLVLGLAFSYPYWH